MSVITKCDKLLLQSASGNYKVRQLLQSESYRVVFFSFCYNISSDFNRISSLLNSASISDFFTKNAIVFEPVAFDRFNFDDSSSIRARVSANVSKLSCHILSFSFFKIYLFIIHYLAIQVGLCHLFFLLQPFFV